MNLLKLTGTNYVDPSFINTHFILTDEGSVLTKVVSDMAGYHHCSCAFHTHQLAVRVSNYFPISSYICLYTMYVVII